MAALAELDSASEQYTAGSVDDHRIAEAIWLP